MLSKSYRHKGNQEKAYYYLQKALDYKEKIEETDDELKLEKIQSRNDLEKKESEIAQLKIDRLEQQNAITKQKNALQTRKLYTIFLIILLILLVVIILFIFNRAKQARISAELRRVATESDRQMEKLKAEESKRSVELKNQLFTNISHEFRTPLTLIQAPVEELLDVADDKEFESLNIVKRNADHLLLMVDEILELSKLDAGQTELSMKEFSLDTFIQRVRMNFEPIFRQKNIEFETEVPNDYIFIHGDEYRLKMVLNNLLKNAFHHTPMFGKTELSVDLTNNSNSILVSLFNSGVSIESDFLPFIFERYSRAKDREYAGYGIGLSFCKQIIELHEGQINAKNVESGVVVSFEIPTTIRKVDSIGVVKASPEMDAHPREVQSQTQRLEKSTILIVEDNFEMQDLIKGLLLNDYDVLLASDGLEGIEMARERQPDLIVSDVMMPKVGGTELTKCLKQEFATSHIPIILLTAMTSNQNRLEGLETGADDYLTKPFSPKELRIRVKNLIELREQLKRKFSKNVFLKPNEITSNSLDQDFLVQATKSVETNLLDPEFNVEKFCRSLALNRNSVHQKLKSLTNQSASQFIKSIKLKKAAIFLADERISIVEVSEMSGFNNRQAFNKAFKVQFEMTPSEYRIKCLEDNNE